MTWMAVAVGGSSLISAGAGLIGSNKAAGAASDAQKSSVAEQRRQFDLTRSDTAPYRQVGTGAIGKLAQLYGLGSVDAAGTTARQAGSQRFKPSEIARLKQQGMSVDDIIGLGYLGGEGDKELRYLTSQGFTPEDISRLQQGRFSAPSGGAGAPGANAAPDMSVFWQSPDYQFNLAEGQKAIDNSLVARGGALSGAGAKAGARFASGLASREFGSFVDRLGLLAGIGTTGVAQSAAAGANAAGNISQAYLTAGAQRGSAYLTGAESVNNAAQGGISNFLLQRYLAPSSVSGGTQIPRQWAI